MNTNITQTISIDDFAKLELKVGTILECKEIEGSEKLLKSKVDLGEQQPRQILSGIKQWYKPQELVGKQVLVVTNLEPRIMMGFESRGMILAACPVPDGNGVGEEKPILLKPYKKVAPGTKVR